MDKIKFALIGKVHIGKRHAEMVRRNPDCELVAVCDTLTKDKLGLEDLKEKFYSSLEEMLAAHPEVHVVNICTPNGLHATHALKALDQDKHVVLEKPMALTKADCEKIIFNALHHDKTVFCVMQNRYSPPSVWLKDIVKKKVIGDIYMVQLNCYWNRDERYYKPGNWKEPRIWMEEPCLPNLVIGLISCIGSLAILQTFKLNSQILTIKKQLHLKIAAL